jgi:hypothetical protein
MIKCSAKMTVRPELENMHSLASGSMRIAKIKN